MSLKIYEDDNIFREYVEKKYPEKYSIITIDFDNINKINEVYGELYCSSLIDEGLDVIYKCTKQYGDIARVNGQRFIVYFENLDEGQALDIACNICREINNLYSGESKLISLAASIGISSFDPQRDIDGKSFEKVIGESQLALNQVKNTTKNKVQCFSRMTDSQIKEQSGYKHEIYNDININGYERIEDFYEFSIQLFERTKNFKSALTMLMIKICKKFDFEKISFITFDRVSISKTIQFEWNNELNKLNTAKESQIIGIENLEQYSHDINEKGILYLDKEQYGDIFTIDDKVNKRIHVGQFELGIFTSILSFQSYNEETSINQEDINYLVKISHMIADKYLICEQKTVGEIKTQFFSRMSHDLRTPLSIIMGISEMIGDEVKDKNIDDENINVYLEKIQYSSQYMLELMNDILELSKLENKKFKLVKKYFDLESLCTNTVNVVKLNADKNNIDLIYFNDGNKNIEVLVDNLRLKEIMINLINNAIRSTPCDGKILFSTEVLTKDEINKKVIIRFSIKDNGEGIEENQIATIFEPYIKSRNSLDDEVDNNSGTGLGLTICKQLVEIMGGNINVKSQVGKGSEFYFDIPFKYRESAMKNNVFYDEFEPEVINMDCSGLRVLLAEDNDINVMVEKHSLLKAGFIVETVKNGQEAYDKFKNSTQFYYDLILMDIRMPVLGGHEAANLIRKSGRLDSNKVKIIATTANAFEEDEKKSIKYGMNGHLSKPFKVNALKKILYQG